MASSSQSKIFRAFDTAFVLVGNLNVLTGLAEIALTPQSVLS